MKKAQWITSLLLFAVSILIATTAVQGESYTTGPYMVTFDTGFHLDFNKSEVKSETRTGITYTMYNLKNILDNNAVNVYVTDFDKPVNDTLIVRLTRRAKEMEDGTVETERQIDGHLGKIVESYVSDSPNGWLYIADWFQDNQTVVTVMSSYPWGEGTLQLLKTIHVEKISETS